MFNGYFILYCLIARKYIIIKKFGTHTHTTVYKELMHLEDQVYSFLSFFQPICKESFMLLECHNWTTNNTEVFTFANRMNNTT